MPLHPVKTTERLRRTYIRYLKTIKPFRDPWLRGEFARALETPSALIKGPLIEASPPFRPGTSIAELVAEDLLSPEFVALDSEALPYHRPLYAHQERAVRKVLAGRNIIVATGTGSGKTETFLIPILNLLLREQKAGTLHEPGVRALLLYPMNALANDQMKRLRKVLAKYPDITFGRYVGNTPYTEKEAREKFPDIFPGEYWLDNELHSREEMRAHPPHILLTNYAMLEYLLLRPDDSPFFDGPSAGRWRFIVMDEVHVYTGAKATEVGMLLRRLLDRVTGGHPETVQAIATSATLGQPGAEHFRRMVQFASTLFGLSFEWEPDDPRRQDVVVAERLPEADLAEPWGEGTPALYARLSALVDAHRARQAVDLRSPLPDVPPEVQAQALVSAEWVGEEAFNRWLYEVLRRDQRLHTLRALLQKGPQDFRDLAVRLFPDLPPDQATEAINHLISSAIVARRDSASAPLLPARYHVFARALEGAFVCLNRDHPAHRDQDKPTLFLQRHRTCPHCGGRVFELATCTRCGAAYLVGRLEGDNNQEGVLDHSSLAHEQHLEARGPVYFSLEAYRVEVDEDALLSAQAEAEEEGEATLDDLEGDEQLDPYHLCPQCGMAWPEEWDRPCACDAVPLPVHRVDLGKKRLLRRCVHCSTPRRRGAVYRFLTGRDAPVSLLLQTLYRELPEDQGGARFKPGAGRKLLSFADSRQAAAFFAPYVERSARREMRRQLIVQALRDMAKGAEAPPRLEELIPPLTYHADTAGVFEEGTTPRQRQRTVAAWLMAEFRPLDRRLSLEGVGLVRFVPYRPPGWRPPERLLGPPWDLTSDEAYALIVALLNTLRYQGAVTYLLSDPQQGGPLLNDLNLQSLFWPRAKPFYIQENHSDLKGTYGIYSWMPRQHSNARWDYLRRVLQRRGLDADAAHREAREALREIWRYLTGSATPWPGLLRMERLSHGQGIAYRIAHNLWEAHLTEDEASLNAWWMCDRCGAITAFQAAGVCPTNGCEGTLRSLREIPEAWQENLYRYAYTEGKPIPLRVEEHTAQWVADKAAKVQQDFLKGDLNVLSCSTTFELGVDLGDLLAVVMHNVPPTTANYVQRAGRAGRRTEAVAYVLTFAQRRSHDLHFYNDPRRMVAGDIRPPVISMHNVKIVRRHVHSVAIASFFRWLKEKHGLDYTSYRDTGTFFESEDHGGIDGVARLRVFLAQRPADLLAALKRIVPREPVDLHEILGLDDWAWVKHLTSEENGDGVLDRAAAEVHGELTVFRDLEQKAADERNYEKAKRFLAIQKQIRHRPLLNFLGSRNVLPKYGFPTDVVPLRTEHLDHPIARKVQLERDLKIAISEFAPGGEVVAGKHIWVSQGIYHLPKREWVPYTYAVCPNCERLQYEPGEKKATPRLQCLCGTTITKNIRKFFVPEHGFLAARQARRPGEEPPQRIYASDLLFADYHLPDATGAPGERQPPEFTLVSELSGNGITTEKAYSRYGWLAMINQGLGQGFRVCHACGYAEPVSWNRKAPRKRKHTKPQTGEECVHPLRQWDLGHRFMTDVLEVRFGFSPATPLARLLGEDLRGTTLSILYALLEGASRALDIPREDINGTLYFPEGRGKSSFSVVFIDAVPGGAGHAAYIGDHLPEVFAEAYHLVAECECGEDTSCYNCLRNYDNQWYHDQLKRGLAEQILALLTP